MISVLRRFIPTSGKLVAHVSAFRHRLSKVTQLVLLKRDVYTSASTNARVSL